MRGNRKPVTYAPTSSMTEVMKAVRRIAPSEATVLISGETGTGKEVVASLFHQHSKRADRAFVPINCGAIPETLLESELFGHARGAFTGAVAARKGRLAAAEGGTLFLDEIGELPLSLQVKLLRVLQERAYEPVGSCEQVQANFRLIAATNRDLEKEVEAGRFRRDLYYRLMVCPIELLPLRACPEDVGPLFLHFWSARGEVRPVAPEVLAALSAHEWPGNVRELENVVERISVCAEGESIGLFDLPRQLRPAGMELHLAPPPPPPPPAPPAPEPATTMEAAPFPPADPEPRPAEVQQLRPSGVFRLPIDLPAAMRRMEDKMIDAALAATNGNRKAAADMLGLQRTTLVEKLRRRSRDLGSAATGT